MKKNLFLITTITFSLIAKVISAQSLDWLWAKKAGGNNAEFGRCITRDANGYVYTAGEFYGPFIVFGNDTLTNSGIAGIFTVKYDSLGNVLWAKGANANGGGFGAQAYDVAIDINGNLIVAGEFLTDTFIVGTSVFINHGNSGYGDIFVVKYDSSGNLLSAVSYGGNSNDRAEGIACDKNGNIYLTGSFESPSITFGSATLTVTSPNYFDIFVLKYDSSGNILWAKKAGGTTHDDGAGICVDTSGNVYITGWFRSPTITFGGTTLTNPTGWNYGYVVKYDASGSISWAKRCGDAGMGIASDESGFIYITGQFSNTFSFDTVTLSAPALSLEMFVVKYDLSGNVYWAKNSYGISNGYDTGSGVATDAEGNVFVGGYFNSDSMAFGSTVLHNDSNTGIFDIFIAGYNNSGDLLWARSVGGNAEDICYGITTDESGNVYMTGYFQSPTLDFDSISLASAGSYDMFIAKLGNSVVTGSSFINQPSKQILVYPNPFTETTTISVSRTLTKTETENVSFKVFDINGSLIATLDEKAVKNGEHLVKWNAENVNPGIYFLKIQTKDFVRTEKLILTK